MQSICWTTRLLSRALRSGFSTLIEPNTRHKPHFVSVACGFPKDFLRSKYKLGKFGDDAWFATEVNSADVIGKFPYYHYVTTSGNNSKKKEISNSFKDEVVLMQSFKLKM